MIIIIIRRQISITKRGRCASIFECGGLVQFEMQWSLRSTVLIYACVTLLIRLEG